MFKDITIGQYYPVDSPIHRLDPRTKILGTTLFIIALFTINNPWGYLLALVFLGGVVLASKVPMGYVLKGLKGIAVLVLVTVTLNLFITPGTPILQFYFLTITKEGLVSSIVMAVRLIFLVAGSSIMTLTTSPIDLTDGTEKCLKVIPFIKRYAHDLSMMMSIALRFIPTLMEETDKIIKAQKARGADLETGSLVKRAKALIPILVPLFISAFHRADELAIAMEARCYRGGDNRTKMKVLHYTKKDYIAWGVLLVYLILSIGTTQLPWWI